MHRSAPRSVLSSALLLVSACGGAVTYSEPVSVKVGKISEGDVKNNTFDFDKDISTESGNPYKVFIDRVRLELDGADPSSIEVERIVLTVASDSKGIGTAGFGEIMSAAEIYLSKSETTVVVGALAEIPLSTTMEIPVTATREDLRVMYPHMLKPDFKVGLRGDTNASLPASFELRVNVQIEFVANE